jgi:hypothetical protein
MERFFDTSAVVPLLLQEPQTAAALAALDRCTRVYAWRWLQVETEAALARRRAPATAWSEWRELASAVSWLDMGEELLPQLCSFNRPLRLRAADAGHLFVFERALRVLPELQLVCFDREMNEAARALGFPCLGS